MYFFPEKKSKKANGVYCASDTKVVSHTKVVMSPEKTQKRN